MNKIKGLEINEYYREYIKNVKEGKHTPKATIKTGIKAINRRDYNRQYYQYIKKNKDKKKKREREENKTFNKKEYDKQYYHNVIKNKALNNDEIIENEEQPVIKSIKYGSLTVEF